MLEVNDFNAVRISLASPEQIRSWSYGEVTKPETINYRTLKPEKDGLFCERIFGPTKDFECYCGKYKKVRYKGIICDKCGVEVARSDVRRKRMGHVELAAPVSHIWFAKGSPSRVGLLLDLSPRNLERVIYFAQYIVTQVDEAARDRISQQLREDHAHEFTARGQVVVDEIAQIEAKAGEEVKRIESAWQTPNQRLDEELGKALDEVKALVASLEGELRDKAGQEAEEEITFEGATVVPRGATIDDSHATLVSQVAEGKIAEIEDSFRSRRQAESDPLHAQVEKIRQELMEKVNQLRRQLAGEAAGLKAGLDDVENLRPRALLTESKYHELKQRYGPVFQANMGAEAILEALKGIDLEKLRDSLLQEIQSTSGQRRKKASKRLRVIEALRRSGNKPEWMILTILPVLPPDLRPMVQLDGGRFAASDLNDLYRRVINRNNRLRRLLELGAPEIIIRNEKRMLQEAVDSLIDNGKRGRAVSANGNHKLKSLSDMLRGKQGRFRQNLLGKRVDYSGRSVIVVGPELKLHQCGLPRRMALELFKPFIMRRLVEDGSAHNIKSARRLVERAKPEVWGILEDVVKERPVLLNRAPTLHRLSIQAFEPVLIDGSAIQVHPLVCAAFNADFDGDQMAVHVPLSKAAVREARQIMLSIHNMLLPSSGEPVVAPTLDMVLGCYYLTAVKEGARGEGTIFGSFEEARLAYDLGIIELGAEIEVRDRKGDGLPLKTSIGRIICNEVLPEDLRFINELVDKTVLKRIVADCYKLLGNEGTAVVLDNLKELGFHYATKSGTSITIHDMKVPESKAKLLEEAEEKIAVIESQYRRGLITEDERYTTAVQVWTGTTDKITEAIDKSLQQYGGIYAMATSGAKGNIAQIRQMAGMRGLMTDPSGRIIDFPIKSSFREGLSVLEYFISTHGARKGLADTALRTSDSGYLTRRLIDVAQDVIVLQEDCGTTGGVWLAEPEDKGLMPPLAERLVGRLVAAKLTRPKGRKIVANRNEEIDEEKAKEIVDAGITRVYVRSPLGCQTRRGICQRCYGRDLARSRMVKKGEAVGIIAAQSIGEPGTQLTMRTFHTGGVVGVDITSGLPRVEELFEARAPKGQAIISESDGVAEITHTEGGRKIRVTSSDLYRDEYPLPPGSEVLVSSGDWVDVGSALAQPPLPSPEQGEGEPPPPLLARVAGQVAIEPDQLFVAYEEREEREYVVPVAARIRVETGTPVRAGEQLTDGHINPQDILRVKGREAVHQYLVEEVEKVYRSQGVNINEKHIETIVRQMLTKVLVDSSGDTELLPGELVDSFAYKEINDRVLAQGGEPGTAQPVLLGITRASLNTESWLAAASFQETTRVLIEAVTAGKVDRLLGLKENVVIGKLILAGISLRDETAVEVEPGPEAKLALEAELAVQPAVSDEMV